MAAGLTSTPFREWLRGFGCAFDFDFHIGTISPDLRQLLAIPTKAQHIVTWNEVLWHLHQVYYSI
jgi:hypothetical protein